MSDLAYQVRDLHYRVGAQSILSGVNLDVSYGRLLALVGPNGAGKSSLLGALCGDIKADAGEILLNQHPLKHWSPRELARHRSVLLQANQVSFPFTVREVVEMGRNPWAGESTPDQDAEIIEASLRQTDTAHLASRPFTVLSGGEKSRVSLARVLAQATKIVLLDEPTAALDLRHQEEVMILSRQLADEGRAVVVVQHDLTLAAAYADEIAIIDSGSIVHRGTATQVVTPQIIEKVYQIAVHVLYNAPDGRPVVIPVRDNSR